MKHTTIEIGEEILDISYEHEAAEPETGFQGSINIVTVHYNGTDLIYLVSELPGVLNYLTNKVWEKIEKEKPKYLMPTYDLMMAILEPIKYR